MKVWELKEGIEYVSNIPNKENIKYKVVNGILYGIFEGMLNKDYTDYNYIKNYDFTPYTPPTDWSKVEVDTKVLVRDYDDEVWTRRHFAKYENGTIYVYSVGTTSFTTDMFLSSYNQAKLYIEE